MELKIIDVTPENVLEETLFCVKNIKSQGFHCKQEWFENRYAEGLRIKILKDNADKMIGFIEYTPATKAWRPINADQYLFIHCIAVYAKKDREKGYGSQLIEAAEKDAKVRKMAGLCTMTSKGTWVANKNIFEKNGFIEIAKKGRFELLSKKWHKHIPDPELIDWTQQQHRYKGWHLLYADQCPWNIKSVEALLNVAHDYEIDLNVTKISSAEEAKNAPSGFGVFNLLHDGKLLEDHYLSATRFRNILQKELQL